MYLCTYQNSKPNLTVLAQKLSYVDFTLVVNNTNPTLLTVFIDLGIEMLSL